MAAQRRRSRRESRLLKAACPKYRRYTLLPLSRFCQSALLYAKVATCHRISELGNENKIANSNSMNNELIRQLHFARSQLTIPFCRIEQNVWIQNCGQICPRLFITINRHSIFYCCNSKLFNRAIFFFP